MKTVILNNRNYSIEYRHDYDAGYPWENDEGCGIVRKSRHNHRDCETDKRPGERPLNKPDRNEYQFYYDWQATMRKAKRDGWNAAPYDAPNPALRAVQQNFDYCRQYLAGDWGYVGVIVTLLDKNGNLTEWTDSLWGVETYNDYHETAALEMIEEIDQRFAASNRFADAMACGV